MYNPASGATSYTACLICPGGYYCSSATTSTPEPCPENSYCSAGSVSPNACPLLFQSDKASENCQPKATLYLMILAGVGVLVLTVSVIVCVRAGGKANGGPESKTKPPTETDRLIPEPVYQGL